MRYKLFWLFVGLAILLSLGTGINRAASDVIGTITITSTITITTGFANPQDIPNLFYALLLIIIMLAFAAIVLVRRSGYLGGGSRYKS